MLFDVKKTHCLIWILVLLYIVYTDIYTFFPLLTLFFLVVAPLEGVYCLFLVVFAQLCICIHCRIIYIYAIFFSLFNLPCLHLWRVFTILQCLVHQAAFFCEFSSYGYTYTLLLVDHRLFSLRGLLPL